MEWIETYLNKPEIKAELGAPADRTFESCNMKINQAFQFNGDVSHNTVALLPPLLESGIRVLIYNGEDDFLCNWVGNEAWTLAMPWSGQEAFNNATQIDYVVTKSGKKSASAGLLRSIGEKDSAGLFTFLQIYEAGHMVSELLMS